MPTTTYGHSVVVSLSSGTTRPTPTATAIEVSAVRHQASSVRSAASRVRRIASHPSLGVVSGIFERFTRFAALPIYDYRMPPLRDRELVSPPPTLASLQELSGPALIAMLVASAIAVLDGVAGPNAVLIGLLAIPPVIAAMSASLPETAVVGAFCLVLAILSILWHESVDAAQYAIAVMTVIAGDLAGLWVASLRVNLNREQAASELLAEAGALMEDALDRRQRAQHLADLAVPALGDVAMVDMRAPDGSIERVAASASGTEVADIFVQLRVSTPIDPHGP